MVTETEKMRAELTFTHPDSAEIDERIPLTIDGLPANERVDIELTTTDFHGREWTATVHYDTGDGRIEMHEQAPADRQFETGLLPAIQAMSAPTDEQFQPAPESQLTATVRSNGTTLGATSLKRTLGNPAVTAHEIDDPDVSGTVFEPPGTDSAPGVIVLHGSGGEPDIFRGRTLASHGFVTAAIEYFGGDELPDELVGVPIETVERATDYVLDHDRVSGRQVGLVGQSKGGELALLAGSRDDRIGAVVSISGSGVVWEGVSGDEDPFPGSSWSVEGQPVQYIPYSKDQSMWQEVLGSFQQPDPPFEFEQAYTHSFEAADESTIADATIHVENIDGPVLLVSGRDDQMWDAARLQQLAYDRLAANDHPYGFDHLVYDDAGHRISVPYQPTANRTAGKQFVYGGSQTGYASADREHWSRVCDLLESAL